MRESAFCLWEKKFSEIKKKKNFNETRHFKEQANPQHPRKKRKMEKQEMESVFKISLHTRDGILPGVRNSFQACMEIETGELHKEHKRPSFDLCLGISPLKICTILI